MAIIVIVSNVRQDSDVISSFVYDVVYHRQGSNRMLVRIHLTSQRSIDHRTNFNYSKLNHHQIATIDIIDSLHQYLPIGSG